MRNKLQIITNYGLLRAEIQNSEIPNLKNQEKVPTGKPISKQSKSKTQLNLRSSPRKQRKTDLGPTVMKMRNYSQNSTARV